MEEIDVAFTAFKCGRLKGADGLNSEHLIYRGDSLKLWLQKIFNAIVSPEEIPVSFKEGIVLSFLFITKKQRIPC